MKVEYHVWSRKCYSELELRCTLNLRRSNMLRFATLAVYSRSNLCIPTLILAHGPQHSLSGSERRHGKPARLIFLCDVMGRPNRCRTPAPSPATTNPQSSSSAPDGILPLIPRPDYGGRVISFVSVGGRDPGSRFYKCVRK